MAYIGFTSENKGIAQPNPLSFFLGNVLEGDLRLTTHDISKIGLLLQDFHDLKMMYIDFFKAPKPSFELMEQVFGLSSNTTECYQFLTPCISPKISRYLMSFSLSTTDDSRLKVIINYLKGFRGTVIARGLKLTTPDFKQNAA